MTHPVLDELRAATRPLHAALEDAVGVMRPGLTLSGYRDYLARLLGFHAPLEEALASAPGAPGVDLRDLSRAPLLAADLAALGVAPAALAALPRCAALPSLATAGRVLGVAYVIVGSALGGAFVLRHVAAALPEAAHAVRALRPYGDGPATAARWRALAATLEGAGATLGAAELVRGAVDTFSALHAWFAPGAAAAPPLGDAA